MVKKWYLQELFYFCGNLIGNNEDSHLGQIFAYHQLWGKKIPTLHAEFHGIENKEIIDFLLQNDRGKFQLAHQPRLSYFLREKKSENIQYDIQKIPSSWGARSGKAPQSIHNWLAETASLTIFAQIKAPWLSVSLGNW